ncbi:hypothetical protein TNCV_277061 [Trichonephila clavipes]|uniref:Ribosomal protein L14 n=1 Tax=Trichonephila clavipes TaxID=2585209 RepID=A0A8X6VC48_TRICX|nr:hypothetical protein TNCV_277061 [Trichonephila clavipes]
MSSSLVPLKTHRVGEQCTLNLSKVQTSSRWCGVVVRRGGASSGVVFVPKITSSIAKSLRVADSATLIFPHSLTKSVSCGSELL